MKKLFIFLTVILLTFSCNKNNDLNYEFPDVFDPSAEKELLIEMSRNDGINTEFHYDSIRRLTKKIDYFPPQILITEFEYDSHNRIIKSMDYDRETFLGKSEYFWNNDSIEKIVYQIRNGALVKTGKSAFKYNDTGYMIHADLYVPEVNDTWNKIAYYIFEWENENLKKVEVWGLIDYYIKKEIKHFLCKDEFWDLQNVGLSMKNTTEFVKLQEETYRYDAKINPLRTLTAGKVLLPFEIRYSKNNLIHSSFIDIYNNTNNCEYAYDYNKYQHPVFVDMSWETNNISGNSSWDYIYDNLN